MNKDVFVNTFHLTLLEAFLVLRNKELILIWISILVQYLLFTLHHYPKYKTENLICGLKCSHKQRKMWSSLRKWDILNLQLQTDILKMNQVEIIRRAISPKIYYTSHIELSSLTLTWSHKYTSFYNSFDCGSTSVRCYSAFQPLRWGAPGALFIKFITFIMVQNAQLGMADCSCCSLTAFIWTSRGPGVYAWVVFWPTRATSAPHDCAAHD